MKHTPEIEDQIFKIAEELQAEFHDGINDLLKEKPTLIYQDVVNVCNSLKLAEFELRLRKIEHVISKINEQWIAPLQNL